MRTSCFFILLATLSQCFAQDEGCIRQGNELARIGTCVQDADKQTPCGDPCTGELIVGRINCSRARHCCFENGICNLKQLTSTMPNRSVDIDTVGQAFLDIATNGTQGRNLLVVPSPEEIAALFPGVTVCPKFPESCLVTYSSPSDLELVNIPYCQRIACRPDNPFLELDPLKCLAVPGCAYDYELLLYRNVVSQAILPGVPVCHLAIRNEVFLSYANEYLAQSGVWNPLLADCLINEHRFEVYGGSTGCQMVRVFEELGFHTKQAGWKGITSRECYLINGCWRENDTCVYPVSTSNIKVKSSYNDLLLFDPIEYGKPECMPFSHSLGPGEFLDSYHTCLISGCSIDVDKTNILNHLYEVAISYLPAHLQHQYWTMVLLGQVRADNWKEIADRLIGDNPNSPPNLLSSLLPANVLRGGPISSGGVSLLPFTLAINTSTQSSLRSSFTAFGTFGQFGHFNPPGTSSGTSSQRSLSSSPNLSNVNLGNFGSLASSHVTGSAAWRNLQSLLSGLGNRPSLDPVPKLLFPCPFQPIQWLNFPPLRGSFEGCCDKPLCFIPRQLVRSAHSEVASYETDWTSWGPCSSSCGRGQQTRRQFCVGEICDELREQLKMCNAQPCPTFSPWSAFSECDATCGGGRKTRSRICIGDGQCSGQTTETQICRTGDCPSFRTGRWSRCSSTCGEGQQTRSSICTDGGAYGCSDATSETRPCEVFCGRITFALGPCDQTSCERTLTPRCVQRNGSPGHCRNSQMTTRSRACSEGQCYCVRSPNSFYCRNRGK